MDEICNTHRKDETCIKQEMSPRRRRVDNIKMKLIEQGVLLWNEVIHFTTGTSSRLA